MRKSVRKFVLGVCLAAMLSMTASAMGETRDASAPSRVISRIKSVIAHILDVVDIRVSTPPGRNDPPPDPPSTPPAS